MDKYLNSSGYDLYEFSQDRWALHVKVGKFYIGSFRKVVTYMVAVLRFKLDEVQYATQTMIEKDHNASHFGMNRDFIFTFQKEFTHVKKVS